MRNLIVKYETLLLRDISEKYFTPVLEIKEIKDSLLERTSMHFGLVRHNLSYVAAIVHSLKVYIFA